MADVIIVPGRGVYPDGTLYKDPKSRIRKAVELFAAGHAGRIIMSGGYSFHFENTTNVNEANSMKAYAVSLGMNEQAILTENQSTHTLANAYFCKKLYREPNEWTNIIVVASSDHLPRAKYVFNKIFGPKYTMTYHQSARVIGIAKYIREVIHEFGSMRLSKKWLKNVEAGDDQKIRALVLQNRPNDTMGNI